jgi:hypothetical protein
MDFSLGEWASEPYSTTERDLGTPTQAEQPQTEPRYTDREQTERQQLPDRTPLPPPAHAQISLSFRPSLHRAEPPDLPSTDSHGGLHQARGLPHVPQAGASLSSLPAREASSIGVPSRVPFRVSVGLARSRSSSAFRLGVRGRFTSCAWMFLSCVWRFDDPR